MKNLPPPSQHSRGQRLIPSLIAGTEYPTKAKSGRVYIVSILEETNSSKLETGRWRLRNEAASHMMIIVRKEREQS